MKNRKIRIITLGCSKNIVDSEKLLRQIQAGGFDIVHDSGKTHSGTVVINTCGFINDAKEESIDTILQYIRAKESGLVDNLYVMGCLSERYRDALKKEIPEVDKYFGVNSMEEILGELGLKYRKDLLTQRILTCPGHYAYLKIAEGCDRTCAFCTIPSIRGRYISRPVDELVAEAGLLAESGVKELILIAQDLSYYGLDNYKTQKLPDLVKELLKIESFEWIRLHYLYPANFPGDLIPLISENRRICRYIDIPIQHISDRMLGLMKRSHNRSETEVILNRLRNEIPGAAIRTTLIAGHPGESENEFLELKEFVKAFRFERLGVFGYSHEEGTFSYNNYMDEITDDIKEARVAELMSLQQEISAELNEALTGKIFKVIIDRREGDFFTGRTEFDSPEVDQEVLIPAEYDITPGNFCQVMITGSSDFDLFGKPVDFPSPPDPRSGQTLKEG
ncbi:MAG: 30S ribosomal protein S12 methylthiotransferase RimO [Bacteroidales bacterium]|nr:30S ribosomal protein S12 methylthiotransferase RimO [Bacteroidales bacterium]